MKCVLITAPEIEPVTLDELKLYLRLDSGTFAENIDEQQSIIPASYGIDYELMLLDVAPGGAGWSVTDTITGAISAETCVIVNVLSTLNYIVKSRSGVFTLGEILSNGVDTADQGASYPTFSTGYYILGEAIDVNGYDPLVILNVGTIEATGTLDVKIQESDDGTYWVDWTGESFTQVTTATDNAIFEKAYTGTKNYIRTVAKVSLAAAVFGTIIIRRSPETSEDDLLNELITTAREHVEEVTRRAILKQTWEIYLDEWPKTDYIKLPFGQLIDILAFKYKESDGTEIILKDITESLPFDDYAIAADYTTHVGTHKYVSGYTTLVTLTAGTNGASGTVDVKIQESDDQENWSDWTGGAFDQVTETTDETTYTKYYTGTKAYIRVVAMVLVAACEFGVNIDIWTEDEEYDYITQQNGNQCGSLMLPYSDTWPNTTLYPSNPITIKFRCGFETVDDVEKKLKLAIKMLCAKMYESRGDDIIGQTLTEDKFYQRLISTFRIHDEF